MLKTKVRTRHWLILVLAVMLTHQGQSFAEQPAWSKTNTLRKTGSDLDVVCEGSGPSRDLARRFALESCLATAADQVNGDFTVQSLSLETERSVNFHSEVSSEKSVTGLACDSQDEYGEEINGQQKIWLKCRYDLTKAKVTSIGPKPKSAELKRTNEKIARVSSDEYSGENTALIEPKQLVQSDIRRLSLTVVPSCDSVLIRGMRPRSVACNEIPVALVLSPDDVEIIVCSSGYLPKHIEISPRRPASAPVETTEVFLERN